MNKSIRDCSMCLKFLLLSRVDSGSRAMELNSCVPTMESGMPFREDRLYGSHA